ncbi:MAG: hypothetical protein AAGC55_30010, partial [Myxococcota bacterium]
RMMAARGLAPISDPGDLLAVLYQLSLDDDVQVAKSAATTSADLPDPILSGALADPALDPRVLDYFADLLRRRPEHLQRIILNRHVADETIADLARRGTAAEIDLIAQNEERLLRHPDIISSMFHNRNARMSTVDRALELAVRNGVEVSGIPAWDTMVKSITGGGLSVAELSPEDSDELFAASMDAARAEDRSSSEKVDNGDREADDGKKKRIPISKMTVPQKIRTATLGSSFERSELIRDSNRVVALAAIRAPGVNETEAAKYASNFSLSDDVVKYIADRRDWTKNYGVKLSLVQNPKTPIPAAVRMIPHLRERDLRSVSRSKNIPSAVAAQARKLIMQRSGRGPSRK